MHAAVFEDGVRGKETSTTCDIYTTVDNSDIEMPVTSKITDSCVDVDTVEEDFLGFDLNNRYWGKGMFN